MEESDAPRFTFALKRGTFLAARYRIDRLLADSSSFALTYLATDTSPTDDAPGDDPQTVAVKEFLPRVLVGRGRDGAIVQPHSPADGREFGRALRRFVHEAQVIGDIESPYLLRVRGCLEENGTAYLLMAPRPGRPLAKALTELGGAMSAADAASIVLRLLEPLEKMHGEGVLHRAISPDAISITADWDPVLHGFSARRHVISEAPEIIPGFAAFEQYGSGDMGPWTDVYACSAILYYLVTGAAPPAAIERAMGKALAPVGWLAPDVSPELSQVIARGLSLMPEQRPHGAAELRKQIESALDVTSTSTSEYYATASAGDTEAPAFDQITTSELQFSAPDRDARDEDDRSRFSRVLGRLADRIREGVRPASTALRASKPLADSRLSSETDDQDQKPERATAPAPPRQAVWKAVEPKTQPWTSDLAVRHSSALRNVAAILIVAVTGSTYWVLTHRLNADLKSSESGALQMRTAVADGRTATTSVSARAPGASGPLQQGVALATESMTAKTAVRRSSVESASSPALPTLKRMNLGTVDADKRLVPVDVVMDFRSQLTNGKEQADQGQYALARRIFGAAITSVDAALVKFSGAESLRSIRAELDSASRRALRACQAENDLSRKRGGTVVPCE
jgi:serine/threonine protein kinase